MRLAGAAVNGGDVLGAGLAQVDDVAAGLTVDGPLQVGCDQIRTRGIGRYGNLRTFILFAVLNCGIMTHGSHPTLRFELLCSRQAQQ